MTRGTTFLKMIPIKVNGLKAKEGAGGLHEVVGRAVGRRVEERLSARHGHDSISPREEKGRGVEARRLNRVEHAGVLLGASIGCRGPPWILARAPTS